MAENVIQNFQEIDILDVRHLSELVVGKIAANINE
jgi:hypothetical protein